eukprot:TRINITY_DN15096_c0_g1_i1.p1 TRINITY_DN15096_c0_g1~~TRINITY_DN15096_c0_g1_i1.p1  ORF type:complete len:716 (-),score=98.59 TRINITY_DN15096_c0_g1_i1:3-2150(-)
MGTARELCDSIDRICRASAPLEACRGVDPAVLQKRAQELLALADRLEASGRNARRTTAVPRAHAASPSHLWWPLLAGSCLVAAAACYAWWPALSFVMSTFMDDAMIIKNANVYEPIDWHRIFRTDYWGLEMFVEGVWTHKSFRPLTILTFRCNYWLHTFQSSGFHIANIAFHTLSSILLGMFGSLSLGLSVDWSFLLSVLFFAHPVHTESVLYIVGRADLLCLGLILLAGLIYSPCIAERASGLLAALLLLLASALLVAAGLCKETGFCFFGLLAGWEILRALRMGPGHQHRMQQYWRLIVILMLGTAACYLRVWYTGTSIANMDPQSNPVAVHESKIVRVLSYALVHGIYGKLLIWPAFLAYDYSLDAIPLVHSMQDCRLLLPLTVYLALSLLLFLSLRLLKSRSVVADVCEAPIIGVAIIVLSFMPMANILFPVGTMIGERLLYIPSAGLLLTLVSLASLSVSKSQARIRAVLLVVAGLAASWRCMLRVPEWADADTITVADGKRQLRSSRVQFNYANILLQAKQYDEALATYHRAIAVDEEHSVQDSLPYYHAGQILFFQGKNADAVSYLEKAVTGFYSPLTIKEEEIFHDYALALWFAERPQDSIVNFQKCMAFNPAFTKGLNNMACAMGLGALTGKLPAEYYDHAIQSLDQAIRIEPSMVLYWRNAIALMSIRGDGNRAATVLQQLVAMDPAGGHDLQPPQDCSWEFYFR